MLLGEQKRNPGEKLGKIALEMGLITEEQLAQALAEQLNMQVVTIGETKIPTELVEMIAEPMAQLYRVVPVQFKDGVMTVATSEPQNLSIQDEMRTVPRSRDSGRGGHRERSQQGAGQVLRGGDGEPGRRDQRHLRPTPNWPRRPRR